MEWKEYIRIRFDIHTQWKKEWMFDEGGEEFVCTKGKTEDLQMT